MVWSTQAGVARVVTPSTGQDMNGLHNRQRKLATPISAGLYAVAFSVLLGFSSASKAATTSAAVNVVVLSPISITKTSDLSFGDVYPDIAAIGTISIDSGSNRTAGGAATLGPTSGTAAQFTVTGEANAAYILSLPTTAVSLNSPSGDTMNVDTFINDGSGTLNGGGTEIVSVGATLRVGAKQVPGSYSGTFDVTVNYN